MKYTNKSFAIRFLALLLSSTGLLACGSDASRPNVILISVDTLRADHLGCYGYPKPTSPFIDSLAGRGVVFESAQATASWTLPSHMSIMTSLYPHSHGVESDRSTLPDSVTTLAEVLQRAGYSTTAFVSWIFVSKKFGFDRGFDRFEELLPRPDQINPTTRHAIKANRFRERVGDWISTAPAQQPFFLFLHLFDPHMNYEPPIGIARIFDPDIREMADTRSGRYPILKPYIAGLNKEPRRIDPRELNRAVALYDGEIRFLDNQLRKLFDRLDERGLLDNTLVVFTSDHGEEFDEHGSMEGHQWTLYDEVLHVPLVMKFPGDAHAGSQPKSLVQSIDIAPTILAFLGMPAPDEFSGRSLLPLLAGDRGAFEERHAFSQIKRFNKKWALRSEQWKLIYTAGNKKRPAEYELYDLHRDPDEQQNIYASSDAAAPLTEALERWKETRNLNEAPLAPTLSREEQDRLRALGYAPALHEGLNEQANGELPK